MRALSLFSGVGGIDLGLHRAGIRVVGQCEADEWRRAVLAERFPGVPCWDDVRAVRVGEPAGRGAADPVRAPAHDRGREAGAGLPDGVALIAGGFPCQDVSVAGRRAGLAGERTGLFWEFHRIIDTLRPRWVLLENVPGLLSSNHGRDFATIIDALDGIGYVGAWRILDSRWFGVPQRRRRVFIVCADARVDPRGERCAEVLAVGTRCGRDHQPGGTTGESVAGALAGRSASRLDDACAGGGQLVTAAPIAPAMSKGNRTGTGTIGVAYALRRDPGGTGQGHNTNYVPGESGVRRLTPRECERLQGFPDDWTLIPWNGKPSPDSRRYAALGDAVTVNVAEWIGRRILKTEKGA